ncbi:MAG: PIN domain-containing protein [Leptolyngbya sp.]|nr:PIN domain-containing protein [Leptolyngbya sp.]
MRVLIDTNIVLDFLLQRDPFFQDSELLFQAIHEGEIVGGGTKGTIADFLEQNFFSPADRGNGGSLPLAVVPPTKGVGYAGAEWRR